MIGPIPKDLENLYDKANLRQKLYVKLRWRLCPFEEVEKYVPRKGKILDLGCGYGILANLMALKSKEREVLGIDGSAERIAVAKLSIGDRKNIQFFSQDIKDVAPGSCRGAVMTDFLHHIPLAVSKNLFKIIYEKLASDGTLVIQDADNFPRWKYFCSLLVDTSLNIGKPLYYRSAFEWKKTLEDFGFRVAIAKAQKDLPFPDIILICEKL
ncbi:MAG: class I SAM-dependent methyltransferase [Candidatus Nealsonbacteria bacterium]|nr:class I SAM-dependent methyltransferase [Candidatus Nealsonbacteria bacterium]